MSLFSSTWSLLRDSLRDTADSLAKSVWALTALLLILPAQALAAMLLSPFGTVGGFVMGLFNALLVGWYLALVSILVLQKRRVGLDDLKEQMGSHFSDVMSVLFIFWLVGLVLFSAPTSIHVVVVVIANVVFNPAPELIYQGRNNSLGLLQDAASFMQSNWPEWLLAHVVGYAAIIPFYWLLTGGVDLSGGLSILQMFGPWFGFTAAGAWAFVGLTNIQSGILAVVGGVGLTVFCHAFLLFRGHLFHRLSRSSRRSRAWSGRF